MAQEKKILQGELCTNCGNQLYEGEKFCSECGTPVSAMKSVTPKEKKRRAPKEEKRRVSKEDKDSRKAQKGKKDKKRNNGKFRADEGDAYGSYPKINPNADWFGNFAYCLKNSKQSILAALILIVLILVLLVLDYKLPGGKMGYRSSGSQQETQSTEDTNASDETGSGAEEGADEQTAAAGDASVEDQAAEDASQADTTQDDTAAESAPAVNGTAVESVSASSYLSEPDYNIVHAPENLFSGTMSDNWCEDVSGQGIGESVTVNLNGTYTVTGIGIYSGLQESSDLFEKNSRPKELTVVFSDGTSERITLEDEMGEQRIDFSKPVQTNSIQLVIESVYAGYKYEDTVISELSLY